MKQRRHQDQQEQHHSVRTERSAAVATFRAATRALTTDEVAKRAYFIYLNQGSPQGREVDHWLSAEAELIADGKSNPPPTFS
ncbi:MAG: DUF2934 domain-containing protein [Limisphaerales bacterium]